MNAVQTQLGNILQILNTNTAKTNSKTRNRIKNFKIKITNKDLTTTPIHHKKIVKYLGEIVKLLDYLMKLNPHAITQLKKAKIVSEPVTDPKSFVFFFNFNFRDDAQELSRGPT